MSIQESSAEIRSQILQNLRPVSAAWSVNGRDVFFTGDFELGVRNGGFLTVTTPTGRRFLVQVHELRASTRSG